MPKDIRQLRYSSNRPSDTKHCQATTPDYQRNTNLKFLTCRHVPLDAKDDRDIDGCVPERQGPVADDPVEKGIVVKLALKIKHRCRVNTYIAQFSHCDSYAFLQCSTG